jgi:dihydrofolate synthase/folylpolyglutamate synthase
VFSYQEAVDYLNAHIGRGMHPGLETITGLLDLMGNPEDSYPVVHIAGTNGKTSVSRMVTFLCVAHGLTTGTFTSPHLQGVEERVSINGEATSGDDFAQAVFDTKVFADIYEERTGRPISYFELTAAMAFSWFADQAVDVGVIEVGLGGRLDATNAAHGTVAVLTSVGMDHAEYLGDTVELIAREKLAIVEEGSTLVAGPLPDSVVAIAEEVCRDRSADLRLYGRDFRLEGALKGVGGWQIDIEGTQSLYEEIFLPLHGRYQTINFAVAIAAVEALTNRRLDSEAVIDAATVVTNPGRMELLETDPPLIIDGAHNADGFAALAQSLAEEYPTTRWVAVTAAMADKDLDAMWLPLSPRLLGVVATQVDSPRSRSAADLGARVEPLVGITPVTVVADPVGALEHARTLAGEGDGILVIGSLYLVGAIRAHLTGTPRTPNER